MFWHKRSRDCGRWGTRRENKGKLHARPSRKPCRPLGCNEPFGFWLSISDVYLVKWIQITVVCCLTSHHFILNKPLNILGKKPFFTVVQVDFSITWAQILIYIYRAWFSMVVAQCLSNAQGGLLWHPNGQAWYQNCPWHWVLSVQARQSWRSSLRPRPFDSPAFGGGHRDPNGLRLTTKVLWGWQEAAQIQCLKIVHNISVL